MRAGRPDPLGVNPQPAWQPGEPLTADAMRAAFATDEPYTVGLEDELFLLDPETLDLAPVADEALVAVEHDPRFKRELPAGQLEVITPPSPRVRAAVDHLAAARRDLVAALAGRIRIAGAGTHPFAALPMEVSRGERFAVIADEYQWAAPRGLCCGAHVHVAVPDADVALAVFNALRSHLPELMALAANAPFLEGADTGLATVRPKLCEGFPRQGVPPSFATLDDLIELVAWGRRGGSFPDASFLWHEIRLHPVHGTIEVRVPDAQSRLEDLGGLAAVVHALVVDLAERHAAGERLPVHDKLRIDENRWRALRHGVHGHLVDLDTGEPAETREVLRALIDRLAPTAERLGCAAELAHARTLLAGTGADRQRALRARASLRKVAAWLVEETEAVRETRAPAST